MVEPTPAAAPVSTALIDLNCISSSQTRSNALEKSRRVKTVRLGFVSLKPSLVICVTRRIGSEAGLLRAKPTAGLRLIIQPVLDYVLHGFGNAGSQMDRPVKCDGSRLLSCLFQ